MAKNTKLSFKFWNGNLVGHWAEIHMMTTVSSLPTQYLLIILLRNATITNDLRRPASRPTRRLRRRCFRPDEFLDRSIPLPRLSFSRFGQAPALTAFLSFFSLQQPGLYPTENVQTNLGTDQSHCIRSNSCSCCPFASLGHSTGFCPQCQPDLVPFTVHPVRSGCILPTGGRASMDLRR